MARVLRPLVGALLALTVAHSPAKTQDATEKDGFWEFGLMAGVMDDRPEFTVPSERAKIAHEGILGGRVAAHLPSRFFLESEILYSPMEYVFNTGDGTRIERIDGLFLLGGAGYVIPLGSVVGLQLRSGLGAVRWNSGSGSEVDFIFNAGTGLRLRISPDLDLRTDARWHMGPSALATIRRGLIPGSDARGKVLWLGEATAGLSVYLGR